MARQIFHLLRILILILWFFPVISSQEIWLNYPEKVIVDEEFSFELILLNFSEDVYDVKIDIFENENRISRILNDGEWKSTFYYVVDVVYANETKDFSLKIFDYVGKGEITIKVRDSGGAVKTFGGYEIETIRKVAEEEESEWVNETTFAVMSSEVTDGKEEERIAKLTNVSVEENKKIQNVKKEVIRLTPQTIKSENVKEESGKTNESRYATYGFVIFCILLGILFVLKNRNYKNEFE